MYKKCSINEHFIFNTIFLSIEIDSVSGLYVCGIGFDISIIRLQNKIINLQIQFYVDKLF